MALTFPPVLPPTSPDAQQAVAATGAWRTAVEQYLQQQRATREHVLRPADFACVADGPFPTDVHHNGLCLPSLYFHWLGKQTAYAALAHSAYAEVDSASDATITLTWIPRTSGLLQFSVWLANGSDGSMVQPDASQVGTISHGGSAGHWTCSHAVIPAPPAVPGGPMVFTVSNDLGNNVDLISASVSIEPRLP